MDVTKELRMLHENILNSDKSLGSLYTQLCKYYAITSSYYIHRKLISDVIIQIVTL